MKVLFCYTNINGLHEDTYSFGLASLVASTKKNGHEAVVVVLREKMEFPKFHSAITTFAPDVIGFSSVSSQFHIVSELAKEARAISQSAIIVCGGVHPTINPDCIQHAEALDGVFRGECEDAFVEFLKLIGDGKDYRRCPNFTYLNSGIVISNPLLPLIQNLEVLPLPDKTSYPYLETVQATGYAPFIFSRGCPFNCTYCSNHAIASQYGGVKNSTRYRSVESSIREIEETLKLFPSIKALSICDDILGLNRRWRTEFLRAYKDRVGLKFICICRADVIDEDFARDLKAAGCQSISFGVESGSDYIRNVVMKRSMSKDRMISAFDLCRKYGIQTNAINIIGVPGETEEMIWETIELNRRIKPTTSGVNIFYPYRGTQLGDYCFDNGLVDEKLFDSFSNERRGTVLKFEEAHRRKLQYYYESWGVLIYPFSVKMRLRKLIGTTFLWRWLQMAKRFIYQGVAKKSN